LSTQKATAPRRSKKKVAATRRKINLPLQRWFSKKCAVFQCLRKKCCRYRTAAAAAAAAATATATAAAAAAMPPWTSLTLSLFKMNKENVRFYIKVRTAVNI
jgi:hypothetical protein